MCCPNCVINRVVLASTQVCHISLQPCLVSPRCVISASAVYEPQTCHINPRRVISTSGVSYHPQACHINLRRVILAPALSHINFMFHSWRDELKSRKVVKKIERFTRRTTNFFCVAACKTSRCLRLETHAVETSCFASPSNYNISLVAWVVGKEIIRHTCYIIRRVWQSFTCLCNSVVNVFAPLAPNLQALANPAQLQLQGVSYCLPFTRSGWRNSRGADFLLVSMADGQCLNLDTSFEIVSWRCFLILRAVSTHCLKHNGFLFRWNILSFWSLRHFVVFLLRHFGRWDISVICLILVSKLAITVFISLYFQTFWPKWPNFFRSFGKTFRSMTEKWPKTTQLQTECPSLQSRASAASYLASAQELCLFYWPSCNRPYYKASVGKERWRKVNTPDSPPLKKHPDALWKRATRKSTLVLQKHICVAKAQLCCKSTLNNNLYLSFLWPGIVPIISLLTVWKVFHQMQ